MKIIATVLAVALTAASLTLNAEGAALRRLQQVCDPDVANVENCGGTLAFLNDGDSTEGCAATFDALGRTVCLTCPEGAEFSFIGDDANQCYAYCGTTPICGPVENAPLFPVSLTPNQGKCIIEGGDPLNCLAQFPAKP